MTITITLHSKMAISRKMTLRTMSIRIRSLSIKTIRIRVKIFCDCGD